MSKGGSQPSAPTTTKTEIDPQVKAAYFGNMDYAQEVANSMGPRQYAGFDPSYQAGESMAMGNAMQGVGSQNLNTAADLTRASSAYAPSMVGGFTGGPAALAGSTGYNAAQFGGASGGPAALAGSTGYNAAQFGGASGGPAAQSTAAQANMGNISQYMNPYTSQVIDASMVDLEKARQSASQQIGQRATAAKAFGGSRQGVADALSNSEFSDSAGRTIAQLRSQGFDTASNLMQQDVGRQQQTGLSNQAAINQMNQFNAGNLQQAGLSNQAARNQAGQFGASAMNQAGLSNQAAINQMNQFNAGNLQQAGLSNQAARNQAGQFGASAMNQAGLSNQAAMNQMNQYNAGLMQQAQQLNQSAGLQGAQFRLGAANQLGSQGLQQQSDTYANAANMMSLGQNRQALAQQQMDASRNLGLERLGIMQGALGLQPGNMGQTTTGTQPMYQNRGANMLGGAMAGNMLLPGYGGMAAGALMGLF